MDLQRKKFTLDYAGKPLVFEVSRIAEQASAAVIGSYGDSAVLATVVMGEKDIEKGYFPLIVDYEERFYAVGKILGSRFMRREGRSSEEAILSGRLIDRTIRPLFNHKMRREVQVVITILSLDEEDDLDFLALNTASVALAISETPWAGPVAGVKIARQKNKLTINPTNTSLVTDGFDFQAFVAGSADRISMIELEGIEAPEEQVIEGFALAQTEIAKLVAFQNTVIKAIGKKKAVVSLAAPDATLDKKVRDFLTDKKVEDAIYVADKNDYTGNLGKVREELNAMLVAEGVDATGIKAADGIFEEILDETIHRNILEKDRRPDGRKTDQLRELHAEVALLKRTHGSGLFVRGNTQALAVATIAPPGQEQLIDTMSFSGKRRFLLHYNFPAYSVGETGPFRGPGRREIGHGALAEKALKNLMPTKENFPYAVRVVSEILSSNGSSSMATVCAASLALMDAGVPLKKPAAGIAMGMMSDSKGNYKVLTDIQGPEDHYGDTDLKVAGTDTGVTAIQMDVKIQGLTIDMLTKALAQTRKARLEILAVVTGAMPAPRKELSPLAPLIMTIRIHPSQIGSVIGPGGKVINGIIERTGCMAIDIDDDGLVFVSGKDRATTQKAYDEVMSIVKEYKVGEVVEGPIIKMLDFGCIVQIDSGHDGMIHISELKSGFVKKVEDVVKMGDVVRAKIIKVEPGGKIGLSLKALGEDKGAPAGK